MPLDRPNVLFICTDQQQRTALGAADGSYYTPNLDRLAERGTRFSGCHATYPQCSPDRASLVTGQYPHQNGMYTLAEWGPGPLDPASPSVGRAFRDAGYRTGWFGKWHLGEGNVEPLGWAEAGNVHGTSNGPKAVETDRDTVTAAREFIRTSHDAPFFCTVSFNLPHPPFYEDEAFADRYDPAAVSVPDSVDDDLADKPAFHREHARERNADVDRERARAVGYQYRTMVSRVDSYVGDLLDELRAQGLREDTVVVFTSDHGDMLGAHGMVAKGVVAYDEILRVPLLVDIPGRGSARDPVPDLVSHVGLPATMLDAAGLQAPNGFEGGSFLGALDRDAPPERERVFFEHKYAYWGEHPYRGVRTREWKYVEYFGDDGAELYDVAADPAERTNLAGDPDHADVAARLAEAVAEWWQDTDGDTERWTTPAPG